MKNNGLIALVALGILLLIAIKFNLLPNMKPSLYDDTAFQESLNVKHDDGVETEYYQNGNIKSETPYKNNKINGILRAYYANGNIKSESNYIAGNQEGETKTYYKDGGIEKIYTVS